MSRVKADEKKPVSTPAVVRKPVAIPEEMRQRMVAEAAYYIAQRRGFAPGDQKADWVAAEREIAVLLTDTVAEGICN